jgi:K+-sensing histidine kinase KdpD
VLVIQDIIDFNKITAGEVGIARNAFVLQDLVDELETLFSESMAKEGVEFEVDTSGIDKSAFGDGSRLMLLGDDSKIRRIAINMLSNAFRFTVKGKVTMMVRTQRVKRNSLEVRFEVKVDNGFSSIRNSKLLMIHRTLVSESQRKTKSDFLHHWMSLENRPRQWALMALG